MELQKRIGIIIGKVYKDINRQLLKGILKQSYTLGIRAEVFTLTEEYYDEKVTEGEKNILNIINFSRFDGIIYVPYSFSAPEIKSHIERLLLEQCQKPVIYIGVEQVPFTTVWYDDRTQMSELVSHLIYQHDCKKILCLTGPDEMEIAQRRLNGYRDAMQKAGLTVSEEDIIFGDFWVHSARTLAQELINKTREMPDAVVCANDTMAIALCDALINHGITVPEDILITGYDGSLDATIHVPSITTYRASWESLGISAMCRLYEETTGELSQPCAKSSGFILCRESCGCISGKQQSSFSDFNFEKMEEGYMDSSLSTRLLASKSFNSFIHELYDMTAVFSDTNYGEKAHYCLCLCEDWDRTQINRYSSTYRTEGYSKKMIAINPQLESVPFSTEHMLPEQLSALPLSVTFYMATHFRNRCFGYSLLTFDGIADGFNIYYQRFCREVNNALAFLCLQNDFKSIAYRNYISKSRDELTGLYLFERCPQMWEETAELANLYGEDIYMITISIGGLRQVEDMAGKVERDKIIVSFANILSKNCVNRENAFRVKEAEFIIIGSEIPPITRHTNLLKRIAEQFKEQNVMLGNPHFTYLRHNVKIISGTERYDAQTASDLIAQMLDEQSADIQATHSEQMHYGELVALRREIFQFPERDWNVNYCAQRLNISRTHFQKIYRSTFDVNCMHDIQQSKMNYAKKLLMLTNDTLQDIAEKCGYDYSHFMRAFKKETGMTPTQYRRGKQE